LSTFDAMGYDRIRWAGIVTYARGQMLKCSEEKLSKAKQIKHDKTCMKANNNEQAHGPDGSKQSVARITYTVLVETLNPALSLSLSL